MKGINGIGFFLFFILVFIADLKVYGFQKNALFEFEEPLNLEIVTNLKALRQSKSDTVFFSTYLKYETSEGNWDSLPTNLRARGNSRRGRCYFPPLWLKIQKGTVKKTLFQGNRSLKLVLPCQQQVQTYNDLITKEYIAYKLYEVVSPYHFKTRMVNLSLTDQQNRRDKTHSITAFLIEDVDKVAKRHGLKRIKSRLVMPQFVNDTLALQQDFFAFMIGNTDWSNTAQHNVRMLDRKGHKHIPVSYDFDYAGFVNAPYALPYDYLPIKSVTERLYRGICRDPALVQYVRNQFLMNEEAFLSIMDQFQPQLPKSEFNAAKRYLMDFFVILKNDKPFREQILNKCEPYDLGINRATGPS